MKREAWTIKEHNILGTINGIDSACTMRGISYMCESHKASKPKTNPKTMNTNLPKKRRRLCADTDKASVNMGTMVKKNRLENFVSKNSRISSLISLRRKSEGVPAGSLTARAVATYVSTIIEQLRATSGTMALAVLSPPRLVGNRMARPCCLAKCISYTHHKRVYMLTRRLGTTNKYLAEVNATANGDFVGSSRRAPMSPFCGLDRKQQYKCLALCGHMRRTFVVNSKTHSAQQCVTKTSHCRPFGCRMRAQLVLASSVTGLM
mmetsp:Transcript_22590/g.65134  ORF Transcript_22590/g.65134 Transcript_22590/m.65134 type:complete len:263 (+) Transcript_22590:861-1649(+)